MEKYIELHLHLDGAITVEIARHLAEIQKIALPAEDAELEKLLTVPADCGSLEDFLKCFALPVALMQTKEGLREAAYQVAEHIRSQGVIYAEIRFAPQLHTQKGLTQNEIVSAVLEGLEQSELKANLLLCCMRGEGTEAANYETLEMAERYLVKDGGVVGLDLAGAEAPYPMTIYKDLFSEAKARGIPFTIHAGEGDGPENIRLAVEYGAVRIGHGVRLYEDKDVEGLVREKGIFLEMCPTSNRQTHAIENMAEYPMMRYLEEGIRVTLNTDDMAIEGTTIKKEFLYLEDAFGLTPEQRKTLLRNAVDGAFTCDDVKEALRKELEL